MGGVRRVGRDEKMKNYEDGVPTAIVYGFSLLVLLEF
jgi:hypothetical protein